MCCETFTRHLLVNLVFARSHLKARSPRVSLEIPPVEKGTGRLYTTLYRVREPQEPWALWPLVGKMPYLKWFTCDEGLLPTTPGEGSGARGACGT